MIKITVKNEMFAYDMYHIFKAFWPNEKYEQIVNKGCPNLINVDVQNDIQKTFKIELQEVENIEDRRLKKRYVNLKLYDWLCENAHKELAWGTLTGVRPTKLMMTKLDEGMSETEVKQWMKENYRISDKKAELGIQVAKQEKVLLEQLDYENGYSLYIGIPFCPTICSYCSFSSYPIGLWKKRVDDYLDAVCKELSAVSEIAKRKNKKLDTVYMGGGTPTTLEADQLDRLLTHLEKEFDFSNLKEITVEAGRPDSITREKLEVLKKHHIGRISINPQTMQQKTLKKIGRWHTVEDIKRVYSMARELGFDNINMDLIAGLPGETAEDMRDTLEQIKTLKPDSLTVHALAMKRASRLTIEQKQRKSGKTDQGSAGKQDDIAQTAATLENMIEMAEDAAKNMDLLPYYLYRQKNIAGNFENVGYAKVDKAGIYNILIMEEKQSIIAVGAGASTKIVVPKDKAERDPKTGNLKTVVRAENVKDVEQYISRIDEMIERKGEILWL